jgi:hypothetical protein
MDRQLIIKDQIQINATKEQVWEILTNPNYIKQWDDIPGNYAGGHLKWGSVIEWESLEFVQTAKQKIKELAKNLKTQNTMELLLPLPGA